MLKPKTRETREAVKLAALYKRLCWLRRLRAHVGFSGASRCSWPDILLPLHHNQSHCQSRKTILRIVFATQNREKEAEYTSLPNFDKKIQQIALPCSSLFSAKAGKALDTCQELRLYCNSATIFPKLVDFGLRCSGGPPPVCHSLCCGGFYVTKPR